METGVPSKSQGGATWRMTEPSCLFQFDDGADRFDLRILAQTLVVMHGEGPASVAFDDLHHLVGVEVCEAALPERF